MESPPIRRSLASPVSRVWVLTGMLAALAVAMWWIGVRGNEPLNSTSQTMPWLVVAISFFAAESMVIHLHFRSESGTFSLTELPLVFSLLFAQPGPAVIAMVLGSVASLALIRRQPFMKLAFNAANLAVQYTLAFALVPVLVGGTDTMSPVAWLAVLVVTSVAGGVSFSMILVIIAITEGRVDLRQTSGAALFALVVSVTNTVQALIAALLVASEPWAMLLLAVPAGVLFAGYQGYISERQKREKVEFLYTSTRALRGGGRGGPAVADFLAETASMFRAKTVMLYLFPAADSDAAPALFRHCDGTFQADAITETEEETAVSLAETPGPVLINRIHATEGFEQWLTTQDVNEAMVGALRSEQRIVGVLAACDRLGDVTEFTETDLRLFSTLVDHAAVSLEKDQMGQALVHLRELGKQLEQQAKYDGLTGLANRATVTAWLDRLYLNDGDGGCVIYVDLDDFKPVNDTYGHGVGDALLVQVAARIEAVIRGDDLAARLGGDEFAVLLCDVGDAEAIAHRLVGSLSAPFLIENNEISIGASVGLAYRAGTASSSEVTRHADIALYEAKETGKGTVVVYSDRLRQKLARQQTLQTDLRRAVAHKEFEVHYQPIVSLKDLTIVGAEALVRWRHPSGSLARPAEFIDEAEQSGLITSVDRLVRTDVLEHLQLLRQLNDRFFVSVNLSARDLVRPNLVAEIAADLQACDVAPDAVVIEVTEAALTTDARPAAHRLQEIRALGPRLALDDFGTDQSSLSHLRLLPIDLLKIARPYPKEPAAGDLAFLSAIVGFGQQLGFTLVAEGIEDQEAARAFQELGCDLGQGYYFAHPMELTGLADLLGRQEVLKL